MKVCSEGDVVLFELIEKFDCVKFVLLCVFCEEMDVVVVCLLEIMK